MPGYDQREAEPVQEVQAQEPAVQTDAWGNAATAQALGLAPEEGAQTESQAIDDVWAWMNEEDGPQMCEDVPQVDPCAPAPLFPIDPAQREAQGLPPSGMPGEQCVVPDVEGDRLEDRSPQIASEIAAEEAAAEREAWLGTPKGRSRGGGGDSIRWRTKDPNHPSPPHPGPMSQGAPITLPPSHVGPMR
jgi:hypothetical protein